MEHIHVEKANSLPDSPSSDLRTSRWGIFKIFYDPLSFKPTFLPTLNTLISSLCSTHVNRQFSDLFAISSVYWMGYLLVELQTAISPVLMLYCGFQSLRRLNNGHFDRNTEIQPFACGLLVLKVFQPFLERMKLYIESKVGAAARSYFLPKMAKASISIRASQTVPREPPSDWCSLYNPPLLCHARDLLSILGQHLSIILQICYLLYVVCVDNSLDLAMRGYLGYSIVLSLVARKNAAGGTGFTFWTDNADFHRLNNLQNIIFSSEYHETLQRNSASQSVLDDYLQTLGDLGPLGISPLQVLQFNPAWLYNVLQIVTFESPLAFGLVLYSFAVPGVTPGNIFFVCYASQTIRKSMMELDFYNEFYVSNVIRNLVGFYEALDRADEAAKCNHTGATDETKYGGGRPSGLDGKAGSLTAIVGASPTVRSQLAKTLSGHATTIQCGESLEILSRARSGLSLPVKKAILVSTDECLLPITLAENIAIGARVTSSASQTHYLKTIEAARLAGCLDLLLTHGNAIVSSWPGVLSQSGQHAGVIGPSARAMLEQKEATIKRYMPSDLDKERIIAARIFMKMLSTDYDLLVIDTPFSRLPEADEQVLFGRLLEVGKDKNTVILSQQGFDGLRCTDHIIYLDH